MKKASLLLFVLLITSLMKSQNNLESSRLEMLQHWAPKVYQDVRKDNVPMVFWNHQYHEAQDFIVKLDFDGDWYSGNSKDNSSISNGGDYSQMVANAYTSFVETETHYFLQYGFFHANDDAVLPIDQHNNDYEQVYICVKKDGTKFGEFITMSVNSHGNFYRYDKNDLLFENSHPKIYIPANGDAVFNNAVFYNLVTFDWLDIDFNLKGHGITSFKEKYNDKLYLGEDAIIYNVADIGEVPSDTNGRFEKNYNYALVDFNELWNRRFYNDEMPFTKYSFFHGDKATLHFENNLLRDPAKAFSELLNNQSDFSQTYIYNPFLNNSALNPVGNPVLSLSDGWNAKHINQNNLSNTSLEEAHLHRNTLVVNAKMVSESQNSQYFDNLLFTYKPLKGNGEISARVYSIQNHIDLKSSAGIMIRNSLDVSSKFISVKTDENKNIILQYREADGSSLKEITTKLEQKNALLSFKINRDKDLFKVYYSTNNNEWNELFSLDIDMVSDVFAGVISYTENKDRYCSIIVDNLKLNEFQTLVEEPLAIDLNGETNSITSDFSIQIISDFDKKILHINTQKTGELKDATLYVYDMMGRLVMQEKLTDGHNRTLDTSKLKDGAYLIKVVNFDGKEMNEKVYL